MKRGFTLVELMVSVVIVLLISGGALLYLNKFNSRQKLEKGKDEVVAALNLAKSYAKGKQLPQNSSESELKYVEVRIVPGGYIVAGANGIGSTYFKTHVYEGVNLMVGLTPAVLYFWSGSGYLSTNTKGEMFQNDQIAKAIIQSKSDVTGYNEITINALGQISGNEYIEGQSEIDFPGLTPAPPALVTGVPSPVPSCTPKSFCTSSDDCCGNQCVNYNCLSND